MMDDPGSPPSISVKTFPGPRVKERKAEKGVCLLSKSAIQPCFMGDCLVCLHEVVCLVVEIAILLMTAAGIRGQGKAGGLAGSCRSSNGCDGRYFLWGHRPSSIWPLTAVLVSGLLLSSQNCRPEVSWPRFWFQVTTSTRINCEWDF